MPKKKVNPAEEPEQTTGLMEQAGEEAPAPMGELPQDMGVPDDALPPELGETGDAPPIPGNVPDPPGEGEGETPEILAVDVSAPPAPLDDDPEDCPPWSRRTLRRGMGSLWTRRKLALPQRYP